MDIILFYVITWMPIIAFVAAILLLGLGLYNKFKKKRCKHFFILMFVMIAVLVTYVIILFIIGMVGFGPGMSEL